MSFASGSGTRFAYVAETAFGVAPATPTFQIMRTTGGGLRTNKSTAVSDEIQADRNVRDEMRTGIDVTGSYNFELSYGAFDPLMEAALMGTWAANVLKNGTLQRSFLFEETLDLGTTDSYSRFDGCEVSSFSLAMAAREKVTGAFSLMGRSETLSDEILTDATYVAAGTEPIHTASSNISALSVAGVVPAPKVRSLNIEVSNNLRTRPVIGSLYSEEFGYARCDVTGTIEAYFETNALFQAVLDHGGGSLSTTIGAGANKKYTFLLPKIIFLDGERRLGGNTDDVMVSIPFRAVYDPAEACSIKITRAVA